MVVLGIHFYDDIRDHSILQVLLSGCHLPMRNVSSEEITNVLLQEKLIIETEEWKYISPVNSRDMKCDALKD